MWVEALPLIEFAYNNSIHSTTKISPFQAIHGFSPAIPASLLVPRVSSISHHPKSLPISLMQQLKIIWAAIQGSSEEEHAKEFKNMRMSGEDNLNFEKETKFYVGGSILSLGSEDRRKQEFQYDGPYLIKKMLKAKCGRIGRICLRGCQQVLTCST